MDILSVIGLVLAFCALVGGAVLRGAGIMALISVEAFLIVGVGTCAAICVQTPLSIMKHALAILPWVMKPPQLEPENLIKKMVEWSNVARKQGLLGLEPQLEREKDDFVRKALQLVVDGSEPDTIRGIMEVELDTREHTDTLGAKVFEGMGVYSPTPPSSARESPRRSPRRSTASPSPTCCSCPSPRSSKSPSRLRLRSGR